MSSGSPALEPSVSIERFGGLASALHTPLLPKRDRVARRLLGSVGDPGLIHED